MLLTSSRTTSNDAYYNHRHECLRYRRHYCPVIVCYPHSAMYRRRQLRVSIHGSRFSNGTKHGTFYCSASSRCHRRQRHVTASLLHGLLPRIARCIRSFFRNFRLVNRPKRFPMKLQTPVSCGRYFRAISAVEYMHAREGARQARHHKTVDSFGSMSSHIRRLPTRTCPITTV